MRPRQIFLVAALLPPITSLETIRYSIASILITTRVGMEWGERNGREVDPSPQHGLGFLDRYRRNKVAIRFFHPFPSTSSVSIWYRRRDPTHTYLQGAVISNQYHRRSLSPSIQSLPLAHRTIHVTHYSLTLISTRPNHLFQARSRLSPNGTTSGNQNPVPLVGYLHGVRQSGIVSFVERKRPDTP